MRAAGPLLRELGYRMPDRAVYDEHRVFFVDGKPVAQAPYHDVESEPIDLRQVRAIGARIDSPFFTADVARTPEGGLVAIEINDGGVSTLPAQLDPRELYEALIDR